MDSQAYVEKLKQVEKRYIFFVNGYLKDKFFLDCCPQPAVGCY